MEKNISEYLMENLDIRESIDDAIEEGTGRMSGSAVLKVMRLHGAFCCPSLSVNSKSVELGKVGCAGYVAQRSFDVEVVNECDLRLPFYIVDQPKALVLTHTTEEAVTGEGSTPAIQGQRAEVTPTSSLWIEPRAQFTLRCSIHLLVTRCCDLPSHRFCHKLLLLGVWSGSSTPG